MASTRPQNFSVPAIPFRPSSRINGGYGRNVRFYPTRRYDLSKQNSTPPQRSVGNNGVPTMLIITMVTAVLVLVASAVALAVVLILAYTPTDQKTTASTTSSTSLTTSPLSSTMTPSPTTAPPAATTIGYTTAATISSAITSIGPSLNSTAVQLIGNFTILNMNIQDTTAPDVCQKITFIITKNGQNASNCQADLSSGSVKVGFRIDVDKEAKEDDSKALKRASTTLAVALTNDSIFSVDPNSITFNDRSNRSSLERNCNRSQQCPGQNVVCISVVDDFVCVCDRRNSTNNGTCNLQAVIGTTDSTKKQTIYVQTTTASDSKTSLLHFQASRTGLQTSLTYSMTSGPGIQSIQTTRPNIMTSGPGGPPRISTRIPGSMTSGPDLQGFQTRRIDSMTSGPGIQSIQTTRPNIMTSGPGLQRLSTTRPDIMTSGPGLPGFQTTGPASITSGPGLQTSRPDSIASASGPQTTRPVIQNSGTTLQTSVSVVNYSAIASSSDCSVFCSPTQKCIPSNQICDKYQDCPDDSDEINCVCDRNHYRCKNGRCIYKTWLCDGVKDCPMGDDEMPPQCKSCNSTQFVCAKPRSCVPRYVQCDGKTDCSDSSDEGSCLKINETSVDGNLTMTSLVSVIYRGESGFHICSDNWNVTWSDSVCKQTGHEKSSSTSYQSVGLNQSYLVLNSSNSASNLLAYLQISNCTSNLAVAVSCVGLRSACGRRSVSPNTAGPYILNGMRATRGAWPWQVLHYVGVYSSDGSFSTRASCGGVLISDRWILTAGHCNMVTFNGLGYTGQLRPDNVLIQLGSLTRNGDADSLRSRVDSVFVHPSYTSNPSTDNDVGLLRLSSPVTFTDTIRPICLPTSTEDLTQFRVCVDTGFGRTLRNDLSNDLLQARMNILSYTDCYNYFKNSYLRDQTQFCAGTIPTEADINFCQGDSGGPLSCQGLDGLWKVIGINSYVLGTNDGTAASTCYLSIASRVTQFVDWIQQTIATNSV